MGLFFQNALVDHIGVYTDTNYEHQTGAGMEHLWAFYLIYKQRSCTGLGAKPQDMTALSIDYVITLTGGAPSGGRCHTNVNTIEKLCIYNLTILFIFT